MLFRHCCWCGPGFSKFWNSCYVSRGTGVRKVSNSKSYLQGHSRLWCHTISHIRFPISDSLQSLSCTVNEILPLTSQNLKTSCDASYIPFGGNIMHALAALLSINQQTKFEVPILFTIFKDMTGQNFKKLIMRPWLRPFYGCFVILELEYDIVYLSTKLDAFSFSSKPFQRYH